MGSVVLSGISKESKVCSERNPCGRSDSNKFRGIHNRFSARRRHCFGRSQEGAQQQLDREERESAHVVLLSIDIRLEKSAPPLRGGSRAATPRRHKAAPPRNAGMHVPEVAAGCRYIPPQHLLSPIRGPYIKREIWRCRETSGESTTFLAPPNRSGWQRSATERTSMVLQNPPTAKPDPESLLETQLTAASEFRDRSTQGKSHHVRVRWRGQFGPGVGCPNTQALSDGRINQVRTFSHSQGRKCRRRGGVGWQVGGLKERTRGH